MKVVGFLLALGIVSTNALSKSAKSSSTRSGSKSGKAEVFEEINALAKSGKSSTRSGSKSGKAALLKKNIAVGAAIATIDETFDFEVELDDEDDRNFWDLDLEMVDMEKSRRGYRRNPNNSRSISKSNARNCVRRCDSRRRGGSSNARGDYCVPDCGRAVCAARRGRRGDRVSDCLRDVSTSFSRSRRGRSRRSFRNFSDSCDGPNIRRSNNGRQRCKINARGKRKINRARNRARSRGRSRRGVDDDVVRRRRRGRDDDFTEEAEDQDFAKDGTAATTVAPPTSKASKEERKAAKEERKAGKKEAKEARKAEREAAASSSSKSAKNPTTTTAATEASFAEVA